MQGGVDTGFSFASRSFATDAVIAQLPQGHELSDEVLATLIDRFDIIEGKATPEHAVLPGQQPALVARFRFVIKNSEILTLATFLNLLKATGTLVKGLFAIHSWGDLAAGADGIINGIAGLYSVVTDTIKRGYVLSTDDFAIVAALHQIGSATSEKLATTLNKIDAEHHFDAAEVEATLRQFETSPSGGSGFTHRNSDSSWSLIGV